MLEWIARGLRKRKATTRYPARSERAPQGFCGPVEVIATANPSADLADVCPTGAISVRGGNLRLDRARCIHCGGCVRAHPDRFRFANAYETASPKKQGLVVGDISEPDVETTRRTLGDHVAALRRSVHIRHVDAGSDGSEEWEIQALLNPYYDIHRLGLFFTAAPRHADILLVTGVVTESMQAPLKRAYEVMPEPKAVVAAGTDACSGGLANTGDDGLGGVDRTLAVDVYVPGSPPSPIALLHGLLLAVGTFPEAPA
jgi:Ni,Fe-hydrogenase III small subunit/ferredoxin